MPHDIHHLIEIGAVPDAVYPLVASAKGLSQWWAEDVAGPDASGALELGFFHRSTIYRLEPQALEEPRRALWACTSGKEWQGTRLEFALEAVAAGTRLRFAHRGWAEATDYFTSCNTTWGVLMFRLKAAAEYRQPGPLFSRDGLAY